MFFFKPKIDFSELEPFLQLENVLRMYAEPILQEHGFKMTIDHEYPWIFFRKNFGNFQHELRIALSDTSISPGGALFSCEWSIFSEEYNTWHLEQFGEPSLVPEIASWDDYSCEKLDNRFRTVDGYIREYDLGKFSTKKLMNHFIKQTLEVRIPMLQNYSDWTKLMEWNITQLKHLGIDKIVDCCIFAKDLKRAGSILKQAEDYLTINDEEYEFRAKKIAERKNYLRRILRADSTKI
ncbi:MAG: hypothetical protein HYZ14_06030 [Bacteroidetes bacterium]|nr:hypothetical protein [Bacteroidota bacterium]